MQDFVNVFGEAVVKCADCGMQFLGTETVCPNCTGPGTLWDLVYRATWGDGCGDGKWAMYVANEFMATKPVVLWSSDQSADDTCLRCRGAHPRTVFFGPAGGSHYDPLARGFSLCDVCIEEI